MGAAPPQGNLALATPAGGSTSTVVPSGVLHVNVTPAATTTTSLETIMSFTLPASALSVNGRGLRIRATGYTAANGNNKTELITFGGTTIATRPANPDNASVWVLQATLLRTGAATQLSHGQCFIGAVLSDHTSSTPAETLSGAVTIAVKCTTPTAIGDTTCTSLLIEILN